MVFRTTFHNTVRTPIPADVDAKAIIGILHDHDFLITMSPIVTRHQIREEDTVTGKLTYDVWENINILPFGLWVHEIMFQCAFTDKSNGVVSDLHAPMGFQSEANYTVRPGEDWDGEGGGWVLEESIESSCSVFLKWFIEGTMVPVRQKMHRRMIEEVQEREQRGSHESPPVERPAGNWI